MNLTLKSPYIETDLDLALDDNLEEYILKWSSVFLSMILPLIPLEDNRGNKDDNGPLENLPEGAKIKTIANRYERSWANREACISIYGTRCQVCNFDYEIKYGSIGEGFIEVHHIIPVSQIGKDYLINPVKDLIPVCANCHAMIHRKNPPFTVDELRKFLLVIDDSK